MYSVWIVYEMWHAKVWQDGSAGNAFAGRPDNPNSFTDLKCQKSINSTKLFLRLVLEFYSQSYDGENKDIDI